MDFQNIPTNEQVGIEVKDGALIVNFTRSTYENEHYRVKISFQDGDIVIESLKKRYLFVGFDQFYGSDFKLEDVHPEDQGKLVRETVKKGFWPWSRREEVREYFPLGYIRMAKDFHRTYRSSNYTIIANRSYGT